MTKPSSPVSDVRPQLPEQGIQGSVGRPPLSRRTWFRRSVVAAFVAIVVVGGFGLYRYAQSFWVYRGYTSPREPSFTTAAGPRPHIVPVRTGSFRVISIWSPGVAPNPVRVEVLLPPGYSATPKRRYPTFYFLHGLPGESFTYRTVLQGQLRADVLIAQGLLKPMIVVVPGGPWREDTEWANGIKPESAWDTFVARDLVTAIDKRFRTIRGPADRTVAGLSEGGYGALNIGLHHPDVFGVIESWSGYTLADPKSGVFGRDARLLEYNSPLKLLPKIVWKLQRYHTFVWFYVGTEDLYFRQNLAFADELMRFRVPHVFFSAAGGHSWPLWRRNLEAALLIASARMKT